MSDVTPAGADPGIRLGGRHGERGQGFAPLRLKDIHFFDAQMRAKFGALPKDFSVVLKLGQH